MKVLITGLLFFFAFAITLHAEIKGEEVTYEGGGVTMKGYIAYDDAIKGKRPGVLVVHEWWGHNEYARKRARMLAELGYIAMALDMFGDGKTAAHPQDAMKFSGELRENKKAAQERFESALNLLKNHPMTNPDHIAAIGYCMGGTVVLEMARAGLDLDGVASFHGGLGTDSPAQPGKVKAAILVCHGAADEFSPPEAITAFKKEMDNAKVDYQFIPYEGAKHSFTNPEADEYAKKFGMPLAYNKKADQESWAELQNFLKKVFSR